MNISYFPLQGGEDLITSTLAAQPGMLRFSRNYECDIQGKYRRIDGYERFDGQPKPSDASYWILNFDAGEQEINDDDTVTGDGSGATGVVLDVVLESGAWTGTAAGYLVLYAVSGTFIDDEDLTVVGKVAVANGVATERGADNDTYDRIYHILAIEATRSSIAAVPGSGDILGVWQYNNKKYAFRNNAIGSEAIMYVSSAAGWTVVDLGTTLAFDTGTAAFVAGETITQGAITAVVRKVALFSGTWAGGDAAGKLWIDTVAGGSFAAGAFTGSVAGAANITTPPEVEQAFLPDGKFEFINHNFGGHTGTYQMYGCDGVNQFFEFDGTYLIFIPTGMTDDEPNHIHEHKNHLFLSFPGGSLQHSAPGYPYVWSAVVGAAELGMGDEITGMYSMPNVMAIWTRNGTSLLYGETIDDWLLQTHSKESGCVEWSLQKMGNGIYLDDRGLTTLGAVQEYGDFNANVISKYVQPWLAGRTSLVTGSMRVKEKNQYRLFFSDMENMTLTMDGNKVIGFTRQLYDHVVTCSCSVENNDGEEELFFGSDDGFVYQLDSGTSFDGEDITAVVRTHFANFKTPSNKKRFRKLVLEMVAPIGATIKVTPDFSYGAEDALSVEQEFDIQAQGGVWAIDSWDNFVWDGPFVGTAEARIDGSGLNVAFLLWSESSYDLPHTLQGMIVHYDVRGFQR